MATAFNQLGFRLLRELAGEDGARNVVLSPVSVATALTILLEGAAGTTAGELRAALGVNGLDLDQIEAASAALRSRPRAGDGQIELAMADSLWVGPSFRLSAEFAQRIQSVYGAEVEALDPTDPGAVAQVNRWVSDQTRGKIPRIVDRLPALTALLVLDAIYFNGRWQKAFDPAKTRPRPFHRPSGDDAPVPMLAQAGRYPYLAERAFEAVALPYGDGSISLDVFLPRPGVAVGSLLADLDAGRFADWAQAFSPREGDVILPKLGLGQTWDLRGPLERLGLSDAFSPSRADFRGISATPGLAIGDVKHRATIEVDEAGTVAAAATSVGLVFTAMLPMPRRFHFLADRPFVFAIRERQSGAALFLGVVVDPAPKLTTS